MRQGYVVHGLTINRWCNRGGDGCPTSALVVKSGCYACLATPDRRGERGDTAKEVGGVGDLGADPKGKCPWFAPGLMKTADGKREQDGRRDGGEGWGYGGGFRQSHAVPYDQSGASLSRSPHPNNKEKKDQKRSKKIKRNKT